MHFPENSIGQILSVSMSNPQINSSIKISSQLNYKEIVLHITSEISIYSKKMKICIVDNIKLM